MKKIFLFFCFLFVRFIASAQENVVTLGIQYKPIFALSYLSKDLRTISEKETDFTIRQPGGHSFGMVIRRGFKKGISLETGINLTKRKYSLTISDSAFSGKSYFSITSYEIPMSLLVYIRLGKFSYMNASLGISTEMFASEVGTSDHYFSHLSNRKSLAVEALLGIIGVEYRTKKSGYFYFGVSYHRPFRYIYKTEITYNNLIVMNTKLYGTYLTADLRYFFHEDPVKKKAKKDKKMNRKREAESNE